MKVGDVINREPVWVGPSESIYEVAHLMRDTDCAFLPIVEGGRAIGVVTDRDVAMGLAVKGFRPGTAIKELMSVGPHTIEADASLEEAASQIIAKGVHRLVVEKLGKFIGVISVVDLAGLLPDARVAQTFRMLADRNHPHFIHREIRAAHTA